VLLMAGTWTYTLCAARNRREIARLRECACGTWRESVRILTLLSKLPPGGPDPSPQQGGNRANGA